MGAEPRFELGPDKQQASALPTEPRFIWKKKGFFLKKDKTLFTQQIYNHSSTNQKKILSGSADIYNTM